MSSGKALRAGRATDALRVVFLDHTAQLSGGELALVRLIEVLGQRIEPHVILAEEGPLAERLLTAGATVEVLSLPERTRGLSRHHTALSRLPGRTLTDTAAYAAKLALRLRAIQPTVVHANSLKSGVYGGLAARLAGVPFVWHLRDRLDDAYLPTAGLRLVRLWSRLSATSIVCNSEATRRTLGGSTQTFVIPSVVMPSKLPRATEKPHRRFRIGMVGRIAPWKGQDLFLRAFAEAFPDTNAEAVIVGAPMFGADEQAFDDELRSVARELGLGDRVEFRGHRDDVDSELQSLDALVHASTLPEPFGQVIVEGMAAGVPVIAARAGGPEEIITDERDGLLYPLGDQAALAGAMRRVRDDADLRRDLVDAARHTAVRYGPDFVVGQTMEMYHFVGTRR